MAFFDENAGKDTEFYEKLNEYPSKLLGAFILASRFNFDVTGNINYMSFIFSDDSYQFLVKYQMSTLDDFRDLEDFIDHLTWLDTCRQEELRKQEVRKNALGKLTSEERTLLGL